jgi:hypothetical protein
MQYLNREVMDQMSAQAFQQQQPYPWVNVQNTLTPEGFEQLRASLPDIAQFRRMVGVKRAYGQAPHDRSILHYLPGMELAQPWKEFIGELNSAYYLSFLHRMLGVPAHKQLILSMEWYYAWQGCAVSPHCDARRKLATHIFYFSSEQDWLSEWGGRILILDDERRFKAHSGPLLDQFKIAKEIEARGNASLFFQRTEHSWHAVRPLESPHPEILRRLFIITTNIPTFQVLWRRVRGKDPDGYRIPQPARS